MDGSYLVPHFRAETQGLKGAKGVELGCEDWNRGVEIGFLPGNHNIKRPAGRIQSNDSYIPPGDFTAGAWDNRNGKAGFDHEQDSCHFPGQADDIGHKTALSAKHDGKVVQQIVSIPVKSDEAFMGQLRNVYCILASQAMVSVYCHAPNVGKKVFPDKLGKGVKTVGHSKR